MGKKKELDPTILRRKALQEQMIQAGRDQNPDKATAIWSTIVAENLVSKPFVTQTLHILSNFAKTAEQRAAAWPVVEHGKAAGVIDLHSEALTTGLIKLCCDDGDLVKALGLLDGMLAAKVKPRLRTISIILKAASVQGDAELAERMFAKIGECGLEPTEVEYAALLDAVSGARALEHLPMIAEAVHVPGEELAESVAKALRKAGWGVEESGTVNEEGTSSVTGTTLASLELADETLNELMELCSKLATTAGYPGFGDLRRFLEKRELFDIILDGANIAHHGQNHAEGAFSHAAIDEVTKYWEEKGKRVLLVLHPKWTDPAADLTIGTGRKRKRRKLPQLNGDGKKEDGDVAMEEVAEEEEEVNPLEPQLCPEPNPETDGEWASTIRDFVKRWKAKGCLLVVPPHSNDDWYWFYAALHEQLRHRAKGHDGHWPQVVSNDLMRDHHWRMLAQGTFLAWRERHMTPYHCWFERELNDEFQFLFEEPLPFSTRAQRVGNEWHFPISTAPPPAPNAPKEAAESKEAPADSKEDKEGEEPVRGLVAPPKIDIEKAFRWIVARPQ